MIAFPRMIAGPAQKAGIKIPSDKEMDTYDHQEYPHFAIFCRLHLGRPVDWASIQNQMQHNAEMIAGIPDEKIKGIIFEELRELGWWE